MDVQLPAVPKNIKWNRKIEKVLLIIQNQCCYYKNAHNDIAIKTERIYSGLSISSILITPLSGIITSLGTMLCDDLNDILYFTMTSTAISFLASILISITKFGNFNKISQSHLTAMTRYTSRQLFLDISDRINAQDYLDWVIKNFDDLYTSSPPILNDDLNKYKKFSDIYDNTVGDITVPIPIETNVLIKHNYKNCKTKDCEICDPVKRINLKNIKKDKNNKPYIFTMHQDYNKYDDENMALDIKNLSE